MVLLRAIAYFESRGTLENIEAPSKAYLLLKQGQNRAARIQRQRRRVGAPERRRRRVEDRRTRTWPMQVTFGEEGSCVSMAVALFFFLKNIIGLARDLPLLLLPTLLLKNLINGGGNFSVRPGLDIGFTDGFIFKNPLLLLVSLLEKFFCRAIFLVPLSEIAAVKMGGFRPSSYW